MTDVFCATTASYKEPRGLRKEVDWVTKSRTSTQETGVHVPWETIVNNDGIMSHDATTLVILTPRTPCS